MKYIYLFKIEGSNIYKIGISKNPDNRLSQLQTGNPIKLEFINSFKSSYATQLEVYLHRKFKNKKQSEDLYNLRGEFFCLDKKDVSNFLDYCKKFEDNMILLESSNLYLQDKNFFKKF